jgi:hypothetical protein
MKLSHTFITLFILLFSFATIHAQEKYEYGQVTYYNATMGLSKYKITISTTTFQSLDEGKIEEGNMTNNFVPVNKVLNDLADKGWEVYNTNAVITSTANYYYYIRKKK